MPTLNGRSRAGFGFGRSPRDIPPREVQKRVEPQSWPIPMEIVPTIDELDLIIGQQVQDRGASRFEESAVTGGDQKVHRNRAPSNERGQIPGFGAQ